jgi:transcriptional regulator with XRE-family HTH domain
MDIVERIYQIADNKNISINALSKKINVSNGYFAKQRANNANVGSHIIEKIVRLFPDVDVSWLLLGESSASSNLVEEPRAHYGKKKQASIAYYDIEASASIIEMYNDSHENVSAHIIIPGFADCDFALNVWGLSMAPIYTPGDIILCKRIATHTSILYGEAYLIVAGELRTLKYLHPAPTPQQLILRSLDPSYNDVIIDRENIRNLFLVRGRITRNTL